MHILKPFYLNAITFTFSQIRLWKLSQGSINITHGAGNATSQFQK